PETLEPDDALDWISQRVRPEETWAPESLPRLFAGLVGVITYDAVREMERLPNDNPEDTTLPDLCFLETRLTLVWDNLTHRAQLVYFAHTPEGSDPTQVFQEATEALDAAQARLEAPLPPLPRVPAPQSDAISTNISDEGFAQMVERAREEIVSGDVIQVVISRRFSQPRQDCHPFAVYRALRHLNPSPYMFYLELDETSLVGASPEVLVRLSGGVLETRPIAGTRPRGKTPEEDEALARELLADPKERAEHLMLVDLGRNDIGRVAQTGSVEVAEWMVVERYSHVMHLVSHVRGVKRDDLGVPEVIRAVFPAGTLSGAPKVRAMEIIEEMEDCRRSAYGGAVGFIGATGDVDMCIAIRMAVATPEELWVQAGAGIVYDSDPMSEAHETRHK
ncbi:MAG: anthranilate synthase component I family protein, partial [Myxococcota bacterium]|nr:anthranilate synthase component I family protein [Myxococcota bacterium]